MKLSNSLLSRRWLSNILIVLGLALLALSLRLEKGIERDFGGPDPYYHARIALEIRKSGDLPQIDSGVFPPRKYMYTPFPHLLLAFLMFLVPTTEWLKVVPSVLGGLAILTVGLFSKRHGGQLLFPAVILFSSVTAFLRTASYFRPDGAVLFLFPLVELLPAFWFLLFAWYHWTSACILAFVGAILKKSPKPMIFTLLGIVSYFAFFQINPFTSKLPEIKKEVSELAVPNLLDLFFAFGLAFPLLLLGAKYAPAEILFLATCMLILVSVGARFLIFAIPVVSVVGGFALEKISEKAGKYAFLLLGMYIGFFIVYFYQLQQESYVTECDREVIECLESPVAAPWDYGHVLAYYGKKPIADGYFTFDPLALERVQISRAVMKGDQNFLLVSNFKPKTVFLPEKYDLMKIWTNKGDVICKCGKAAAIRIRKV